MPKGLCQLEILRGILPVLMLFLTSCQYFSKPDLMYVISLHELASKDRSFTQLAKKVWNPQQTRQVDINTFPFLDAKRFYMAEMIPDQNSRNCGLRLHIDKHGRNTLLQTASLKKGEAFAVLVDGFFIGMSHFPKQLDELSFLDLAPLWTVMEAEKIIDFTKKNYLQLNQLY